MNLQDTLNMHRDINNTLIRAGSCEIKQIIDALEIAVSALEFECDNRCAEQNPCNAKESIEQIKTKLGCV
jgi:hypothetical protein